ncbi:hypothetical protein Micbo1qcDRAFT_124921, partial [Microdochium bolleyi]
MLTFEDECRLARNVAFLAYAQEDPNCIPAVCVEQDVRRVALNIRLATNSGTQLLKNALAGLQKIFDLMAAGNETWPLEEHIFTLIIEMCSERILTRLGLASRKTTAGRKQKQPFVRALEGVRALIEAAAKTDDTEMSESKQGFLAGAREVSKSVTRWEDHRSIESLKGIVAAICHFKDSTNLDRILASIPDTQLVPTAKVSIKNKVNKVSRYRELARWFSRRARDNAAYRQLQALQINLPERFHGREPCATPKIPLFIETINLATFPEIYKTKTVKRMYNILQTTAPAADAQFRQRLSKTLGESKIHAEVQLAYFYELNKDTIPLMPRAVCSSKDACWLCNIFVDAHGKMFTPRCHGVLYPGWRQPHIPGSSLTDSIVAQMAARLRRQVAESVRALLQRGERTVYPQPNESTLTMLSQSLST